MNTILFFAALATLTIFYTLIGFFASKNVKTTTDYFLAGRNLGVFQITMTLVATQVGGGMLLGTSENAYLYGVYGILYTLGMTLGFLLLAMGFAARLQSMNVATTAEIFESKYQSPFLKKIASLLSIITMSGILIGQIVGSRTIIATLNMGIYTELIFIAMWLFIIFYTMAGGLEAVVITDILQVILIIAVFFGIFLYSILYGPSFGWSSIIDIQNSYFGTMPISLNTLAATLIMPALFSLIEQDLAQRFFSARTQRIATFSAIFSCILLILFALIPIYLGMQAKLLGIIVPAGESPLVPVIEFLTNEYVVVLALCAIIAAITSTADSLLCAISSNVAQDFEFQMLGSKSLIQSKIITLIVGIIALASSYFVPQNVITILIDSYALSVSCLLVPLVWAYFSERSISRLGAFLSVALGFIAFIVTICWPSDYPTALIPVIISAIGYTIGKAFTT